MPERDLEDRETTDDDLVPNYAQATVNELEEQMAGRIQNPDWVVATCTECHSDQNEQYMERNVFAQSGQPVVCQYCGGIVVIGFGENRESMLKQLDARRGVAPTEGPRYPR